MTLEKFFPVDQATARAELDINSDAVLIGFGADDLSSKRKGFHHLLSALKQLKTNANVECIVFGNGDIPEDAALPKFHSMGFVDSAQRQRLVYSAADLVVVPSRQDNQPQVGLEAMACGIPVVAFDAGGIPEYARDGVTGCTVELGNEEKLAAKISSLCDLKAMRLRMGAAALDMVRSEFDLKKQTAIYHDLYQSVAGQSTGRAAA